MPGSILVMRACCRRELASSWTRREAHEPPNAAYRVWVIQNELGKPENIQKENVPFRKWVLTSVSAVDAVAILHLLPLWLRPDSSARLTERKNWWFFWIGRETH
jgi:hypothetical protein